MKRHRIALPETLRGCRSFEVLEERRMLAAIPALVKDINVSTADAQPRNFVEFQGAVYFTANGSELWKTDGTEAGTQLLAKLAPHGYSNSKAVVFNNQLWLTWNDGVSSYQMWRSDGTREGTFVAFEKPSLLGNSPMGLTVAGNQMFFSATDPASGRELWKSDGTADGTMLVKDIAVGGADSRPFNLTQFDGKLAFTADDGVHGRELWVSDGTEAGTNLVKEIQAGSKGSTISKLVNVGGTLFFGTYVSGDYRSLYRSDGTTEGTVLVAGVRLPDSERDLVELNGSLYFVGVDDEGDRELWKTDGSNDSVTLVLDINEYGSSNPEPLRVANGKLYFVAAGRDEWGVWESDGTAAGTHLFSDLPSEGMSRVEVLANIRGTLVAVVSFNSSVTKELWSFAPNGAKRLLRDQGYSLFLFGFAVLGDAVLFAADASFSSAGSELWKSDGTRIGTAVLKDLNTTVTGESSNPEEFVTVGATTFFLASDGVHGNELWKTDGTEAGTRLVKDLNPGAIESDFTDIEELNGSLMLLMTYDSEESDDPGVALWKSDGTEAGTVLVRDFGLQQPPNHRGAVSSGGSLYFALGNDLWKSDGTPEGTLLTKHTSDRLGGRPENLTDVNGTLFFTTRLESGIALWKSNGTEAGTEIVKQFAPLSRNYEDNWLRNVDGRLFFSRGDRATLTLWTSDGTEDGTLPLITFQSTSRYLTNMATLSGKLIFSVWDDNESGLYSSDGTAQGTFLLRAGNVGEQNMVELKGLIYFGMYDPAIGSELWKTDGSATGTAIVKDVEPNPYGDASPRNLISANGRLYFQGDDQTLWTSDGTAEGTFILSNQVEAVYLWVAPHHIFFANRISDLGTELWALPLPSKVVGRHVFYNNSAFDQYTPEVSQFDDEAIAIDKTPYLAKGGSANAENLTSYSRGINGLMVDIAGAQGAISAEDFTFRVGANNDPGTWTLAPAPLSVSVRPGAGVDGSDRVTIVWPDGVIKDTWLQVIVEGNDAAGGFNTNTGLLTSDVFYWGNKVGDSGTGLVASTFDTTSTDVAQVYATLGANKSITDLRDYNRDGQVDSSDSAIVFASIGRLARINLGTWVAHAPPIVPSVESAHVAFALAITLEKAELCEPSHVTHDWIVDSDLLDLLARNDRSLRSRARARSR